MRSEASVQSVVRTAMVLGMLGVLVVAYSAQRVQAAPPERVAVTGVSDLLSGQVGGAIVPGATGHLHLRQAAFQGSFTLHGAGISIQGTQVMVLNGVLDATLSGRVAGQLTVTAMVGGQQTTIWKGAIHGTVTGLSFTGRAVLHGVGPSAGDQLTLAYQERPATPTNPNPEVFDLTGILTHHP